MKLVYEIIIKLRLILKILLDTNSSLRIVVYYAEDGKKVSPYTWLKYGRIRK